MPRWTLRGRTSQVVSIHTPLFPYHWETGAATQMSKEVNDEIAGMTKKWPDRFAGLATLPVQDVDASIEELERAVKVLGLKGAELDMAVNGDQLGRTPLPATVQSGRVPWMRSCSFTRNPRTTWLLWGRR